MEAYPFRSYVKSFRPMSVRELRHFLERFVPDTRLWALTTDVLQDAIRLPCTVGELLDLIDAQQPEDEVSISSPDLHGLNGVCGCLNVSPPILFLTPTSKSIQSN